MGYENNQGGNGEGATAVAGLLLLPKQESAHSSHTSQVLIVRRTVRCAVAVVLLTLLVTH